MLLIWYLYLSGWKLGCLLTMCYSFRCQRLKFPLAFLFGFANCFWVSLQTFWNKTWALQFFSAVISYYYRGALLVCGKVCWGKQREKKPSSFLWEILSIWWSCVTVLYDLYKCISAPSFFPLGDTGRLEVAKFGYSPSSLLVRLGWISCWLRSATRVSLEGRPLFIRTKSSGGILKWLFPFSCLKHEEIFLWFFTLITCWGVPGIKIHEGVCSPPHSPNGGPLTGFLSSLSTQSLPGSDYGSCLVSLLSLYLLISPKLGQAICPMPCIFLMSSRRVADF